MRLKDGLLPLLLIVIPGGCAKSPGPDLLHIDAGSYHVAFDAAMEASRTHGLTPALRDRRRGVIETQPALAASILEPWRDDNASLGQSLENTIAFQRRRARFEFVPAGAAPPAAPAAAGPDLLAVEPRDPDLSAYEGELELRVRVYVERAHTMGIRRATWSRASTTRATIDAPASDGEIPAQFWTPVSRDEAFERRLLAAVDHALQD
ncbi:MAG: hypothetical protein ACYS1E_08385 [Planctomycetota bacterium]|jgi:hypothetical protein